jgi:GTP cyclohydrolase II
MTPPPDQATPPTLRLRPARAPDPESMRLRAVHRALAEQRRGTPVLLTGPEPLIVAAAETVGAEGLAAIDAVATAAPVLLLAPVRAAAVLSRPVEQAAPAIALRLPAPLLTPAQMLAMADPTAEQIVPEGAEPVPAPQGAAAALSLVKLARLLPAAIAAPVGVEGAGLAASLGLLSVPAADVLAYPAGMAATIRRVAEARVPLAEAADTRVISFRAPDAGIEHLAVVIGRPEEQPAPLVRLHSECFTGDVLGSLRCDCGPQLRGAISRMAAERAGILLYLAQEGRGIGLANKLRAYALQDRGLDTLDANRALGWGADERSFLVAATMLRELGVNRLRLLTNNPDKVAALIACGLNVTGRETHIFAPNGINDQYLATKAARFGHLLGD